MASLPHGIAALLTAVLLLGGVAAKAQFEDEEAPPPVIYKWVDENGVAHYTTDRDRIPRELRDRFVLPERAPPRAAPAPSALEPSRSAPPVAPRSPQAATPQPERIPPASEAEAAAPADEATARKPTSPALEAAPGPPAPPALEATPPPPALAPPAGEAPAPPEAPVAAAVPAAPPADPSSSTAAAPPSAPAPARPAASPRRRTARSADWAAMDRQDEAVAERDLGSGDFAAIDAGATSAEELDERIRLLEAEIQADEEVLKALLAAPGEEGALVLADDPELRAIAERLPDRLKDLQALRDERGARGDDGASEAN
jgi:hypothetical protein